MNDEEMERRLREAHEHHFQVATSGLTSIRYCTSCGISWILKSGHRQFKNVQQWEAILETD